MSEHQFVHFIALDKPLDDKALAYMRRQSGRARITPWEFVNEYHYGDFRGDAKEMLRRGYDIHLHYANFGIRRLAFRLPAGLPGGTATLNAYLGDNALGWIADGIGPGGILYVEPAADAGTYREYWDNLHTLLPRIAPAREMLLGGDLRPLYLGWLATIDKEDTPEPPVPAGLDELPPALEAMAEFYEISQDLIAAAAQRSPAMGRRPSATELIEPWVARQPVDQLRGLVERFMTGDAAAVRAETMVTVREQSGMPPWPTGEPTRTLAQVRELAIGVEEKRLDCEKKASDLARAERLKEMAADPKAVIADVMQRVKLRSRDSYAQAAAELADLREALGPDEGGKQVAKAVQQLRTKYPTLKLLISELRKKGLMP